MSLIEQIELAFADLKSNMEQFSRGNKSAGTRARACAQNIRRIAQEMRDYITAARSGK